MKTRIALLVLISPTLLLMMFLVIYAVVLLFLMPWYLAYDLLFG